MIYRPKSESEDVAQIFIEVLKENIKNIHKKFDFAKKMIFTCKDGLKFKKAKQSWICKGSFDKDCSAAQPKADKVRDHCHFTGKPRI